MNTDIIMYARIFLINMADKLQDESEVVDFQKDYLIKDESRQVVVSHEAKKKQYASVIRPT